MRRVVRDGIPSTGVQPTFTQASVGERLGLLRAKLLEEALEVYELRDGTSVEALTEELADVYEVLRALTAELGVTVAWVASIANAKRERVGGFDSCTVLTWGKP
jgi:predicted house-cleaning noncanonical NTP pyrophosphatase (MazG superfamily)